MQPSPIAEVIYLGELRTESKHLPSSNTILTDAPPDNHGKGEYFSPTDLVATAWLACMFTIIGILLERHQITNIQIKGQVTKIMYSEPRRIGELHAVLYLRGALSEKQKAMLEHAARNCPVAKSLSPEIKQVIQFHYDQ